MGVWGVRWGCGDFTRWGGVGSEMGVWGVRWECGDLQDRGCGDLQDRGCGE